MKTLKKLLILILIISSITNAEVKLGITAPLSGNIAECGIAVKNGALLAKEEHPNLELYFEDNMYIPKNGISSFYKLTKLNKVDVVFSWGESILSALAPIAERSKAPMIAMSYDPEPSLNSNYIIRSINHSKNFTDKLLNYLRNKDIELLTNMGIITVEDAYQNSLMKAIESELKADEKVTTIAKVNPDDTDIYSVVTKLKRKQFSIVGVYLFPDQVIQFYKIAREQNLKFKSFGSDIFDNEELIKSSMPLINNSVFPTIDVPKSFRDKYLAKYKNSIQVPFAYNAYIMAKIVAGVDVKSGNIIEQLKNIPSILKDNVKFSSNNEGGMYYDFPITIKKVIDEKVTTVK